MVHIATSLAQFRHFLYVLWCVCECPVHMRHADSIARHTIRSQELLDIQE